MDQQLPATVSGQTRAFFFLNGSYGRTNMSIAINISINFRVAKIHRCNQGNDDFGCSLSATPTTIYVTADYVFLFLFAIFCLSLLFVIKAFIYYFVGGDQ